MSKTGMAHGRKPVSRSPSGVPKPASRSPSTASKLGRSHSGASKPASRSPSTASKLGRSPSRASKPARRSPSGASKPASRSPSGASKPASRSPSRTTKPASQSPSKTTKPASQSPSKTTKPASQSPSKTTKPASQSPSKTTKPASQSPSKTTKPVSQSPSRTPARARRPLIRRPAPASSDRTLYVVCGLIALLSTVTIIVMGFLYFNLKEVKSPHDPSMDQLRITLAEALKRPDLLYRGDMEIAEEVKNLPSNIQVAESIYNERKRKYSDLFHKIVRSSSSPWKLHGKSLYYFSKQAKTWYDAENFCLSRDAHLASVRDNEEQNFISSQLQRTSWIGLRTENVEGTWRWSDGSRLVTQYWSEDKPSNAKVSGKSSQDCALMVPSLTARNWNDENCYKLYGWICKENLEPEEP